jgi:mono/diheme cytochrome c family protein
MQVSRHLPLEFFAGLVVSVLVATLTFTGCGSSNSNSGKTQTSGAHDFPTMTDNYFDRGHRAYLDNCSRCHGTRTESVHQWLAGEPFSEFHIKSLVRKGSQVMPPIPTNVLDDFTLNELLDYLRIVRRTTEPDTSAISAS